MDASERRDAQRDIVDRAFENLSRIVNNDFSPGYFNRPEVRQAEAAGLEVCDGVLGHVLGSERDPAIERMAVRLLERARDLLVPDEVFNRCHNLHAALAIMLDRLGCPAISVWGTVNASAAGTRGFVLNATLGAPSPSYRPGHAWLLSPYWNVADLALRWQRDVGDDHLMLESEIPSLILSESKELSEPERDWWRFPDPEFRLPVENFVHETKYQDVLGWTKVEIGRLTLRYLPGAVVLPQEQDINEIDVLLGGRRPGDFWAAILPELS